MKKTWNEPVMEELSINDTANGTEWTEAPDGEYVAVHTPCGWKKIPGHGSCK